MLPCRWNWEDILWGNGSLMLSGQRPVGARNTNITPIRSLDSGHNLLRPGPRYLCPNQSLSGHRKHCQHFGSVTQNLHFPCIMTPWVRTGLGWSRARRSERLMSSVSHLDTWADHSRQTHSSRKELEKYESISDNFLEWIFLHSKNFTHHYSGYHVDPFSLNMFFVPP